MGGFFDSGHSSTQSSKAPSQLVPVYDNHRPSMVLLGVRVESGFTSLPEVSHLVIG